MPQVTGDDYLLAPSFMNSYVVGDTGGYSKCHPSRFEMLMF